MQKIMIIGPCGAGKSTLARELHELSGLPLLPLDQHYFKPDWIEMPKAEWSDKVKQLSNQPSWIIDGNYGGTMDIRLRKADAVIFLDFPTWKCFYRVIKRTLMYYKKTRPDMAEGCRERFSLSFLHYVLFFRLHKRPGLLKRLKKAEQTAKIIILKNDKQVRRFLVSLEDVF